MSDEGKSKDDKERKKVQQEIEEWVQLRSPELMRVGWEGGKGAIY